jgi:hypothetical protein
MAKVGSFTVGSKAVERNRTLDFLKVGR